MILTAFVHDIKQNPMASLLAIVITAIGLASTFLILVLYMADRNIDRSHPAHQRLFRIESQFNLPNGDKIRSAQVPLPLIDALQKQASIESVGYVYRLHTDLRSQGRLIPQMEVFAASPAFLSLLRPYHEALPAPGPNEIYITTDFNRRYLGLDSPLGKTVDLGANGQFTIKALVEPRPDTSLHLPALIAFSPERMTGYHDKRQDWYDTHVYAFVRLLHEQSTFDQHLLEQIVLDESPQLPGAPFTPSTFLHFRAKPIQEMHYDDGYADELVTTRSASLLYTLYAAALFVLLTTVTNFFNINGVLNAGKRHSFRIKRSIGASNMQIIFESLTVILPQFLAIVTLGAMLIGALALLSSDVAELLAHLAPWVVTILFLGVTLFIGLIVLLSHLLSLYFFIFVQSASRTHSRYENVSVYYLNRFTLMVQLLVAGITIYLWTGVMVQSTYVMDADLGYQKENRLTFILDESAYSLGNVRDLQNRLKEATGTSAITLSSWRPFDMSRHVINVQHAYQQAHDQFVSINVISADEHFAEVWGLQTLAGQENILRASLDNEVCHAIVTQAFMHAMGQHSYDETLNSRFYIPSPDGKPRELRVLRVVNNFSLGDRPPTPQPLIIFINDRLQKFAALTYPSSQHWDTLVAQIKRNAPPGLRLQTAQELHQRHFHNDTQALKVVTLTALMALLLLVISTLVIGIAEAQRLDSTLRIMESVGGSFATNLVFFLRQNVLPMLLALLIALTLGFTLLKHGLRHYDSVTGLAYVYALAALLLLGMTMMTIMALTVAFSRGRLSLSRSGRS